METIQYWEVAAIPVIFLLGSLLHFTYDWSGQKHWVGLFSVSTESVWEHQKQLFFPFCIYAIIEAICWGNDLLGFWTAKAVAVLIGILFMICGYYVYKLAVKRHIVVCNVLLLLVAVAVTQHLSIYFLEHQWFQSGLYPGLGIPILLLLVVIFVVWTYAPPKLPVFCERKSQSYGMLKKKK